VSWVDGARASLGKLRTTLLALQAGVPRTRDEELVQQGQALSPTKKKRGDKAQGLQDDWAWAPSGVKEAAAKVQRAREQREKQVRAPGSGPSASGCPPKLSAGLTGCIGHGPGACHGARALQACGESKRLVVESPWSQFTSECQRF
jgi:hypothetical protein